MTNGHFAQYTNSAKQEEGASLGVPSSTFSKKD